MAERLLLSCFLRRASRLLREGADLRAPDRAPLRLVERCGGADS